VLSPTSEDRLLDEDAGRFRLEGPPPGPWVIATSRSEGVQASAFWPPTLPCCCSGRFSCCNPNESTVDGDCCSITEITEHGLSASLSLTLPPPSSSRIVIAPDRKSIKNEVPPVAARRCVVDKDGDNDGHCCPGISELVLTTSGDSEKGCWENEIGEASAWMAKGGSCRGGGGVAAGSDDKAPLPPCCRRDLRPNPAAGDLEPVVDCGDLTLVGLRASASAPPVLLDPKECSALTARDRSGGRGLGLPPRFLGLTMTGAP
jgi:hypothetical protein